MARKKKEEVTKVEEPKLKHQYHQDGTPAPEGTIFVFGSNDAGFHGAGAAKRALDYYGAKMGPEGANGLHGQSYAIPTKDQWIQTKDFEAIKSSIRDFVQFTKGRKDLKFFVTRVGCGLAGLENENVAPIFEGAINCSFAEEWKDFLEDQEEVE
jgi:hypothetical protein